MDILPSQLTPRKRAELLQLAKSLQLKSTAVSLPPITRSERGERVPLSFAQQRLWFLSQMEGVSEAYHMPLAWRLIGDLDRAALKRALDRIVWRHEALRTNFATAGGEPVQRIAEPERGFELQEHDLSEHAGPEIELERHRRDQTQLERRMRDEVDRRFDLEHGRLIRGHLIRLAAGEHVLLIVMHHIVSDGWSMGVFARELSTLYAAYRAEQPDPLPPLTIQYADYAVGQRQRLTGEVFERQSEYWRRTLQGAPGLLELPTDRTRPSQQSFAGEVVEFALDAELTRQLKGLSRRHGMTLYMLVVAAWAAVLARLSGQADVVIGTVVANRTRPEVEGLIGFFVNTQALRVEVKGSVAELLERVKARTLEAQEHQELSFEQVVEIVKPARSLSHAPIFQVILAWQSNGGATLPLPGLKAEPVQLAYNVAKFDLDLGMGEVDQRILGGLAYATALFDRGTIERHAGYLCQALAALVADERQPVDRIPLLSPAERRQLLVEWNATQASHQSDRCIHECFEAQAASQPQAIAASDAHRQLSYGDLNAAANRLARHLRTLGVGPDERVAICLDRGVDLLIGLLGVLKAGGAYVPVDPSNPRQRLREIFEDSQPRAVLTHRQLRALLPPCRAAVIVLDQDWNSIAARSPDNLHPQALGLSPSNLAYVIFTSGSTGRPKGVMVEHRSVVNLLRSMCAEPGIRHDDRVLALTTVSFDIAAFELFLPLLVGAEVVFASGEITTDGWLMGQLIEQRAITVLQATPATWRLLLEDKSWRAPRVRALSGGEALARSLASQVLDRVRALWNGYGPTETTIYSTIQQITAHSALSGASEPIGRPVAHTRIYILDGHYEPVPTGVTGEIYIGGLGVARGYLGKPDLTLQRFIPDPFASEPGSRMYRTGDLGRWRADGRIEFLGRNDFQVKLRGFRIELCEIEARLAEHPGVRDAVVLAREDHAGDKRLVAYVTPAKAAQHGPAAIDVEVLRAHLSSQLPEYMVPAAYVSLASLPLTSSGKLDRKALPAPDSGAYVTRGYEAPVGDFETTIARVWAEILKLERVGRNDNFFELGGHSLLVVKAATLLRQSGIETTVAEFFNHPAVESFAASLRNASASTARRTAQRIRGGTQTPLFLVHDGFGDELYFFALARHLPNEWPLYGLPSVPPGEPRLDTVPAMAQRLVHLLQQVQAAGPYRLAGWSFGGVLAYEIARQLLDRGHEVEFLGLLDAFCPHGFDPARHRETTPEARILPENLAPLSAQQSHNWEIHSRAMAAYRPAPIAIPLHLFVASERPPRSPESTASLGWEHCVPAHLLYTQAVPGSHRSMMSPPHIETLSRRLTESVAAAVESKYVSEPV
ncbi:MAG TPA: amino acid adenylation domain-containing protein [Bryobacteraceae bacterium]|jgi:arthrofactin-type cyclic lipopeptide synthetase C|nr:amino acid adenylation domain-containing protein [Bryobacteraceae bacterium]